MLPQRKVCSKYPPTAPKAIRPFAYFTEAEPVATAAGTHDGDVELLCQAGGELSVTLALGAGIAVEGIGEPVGTGGGAVELRWSVQFQDIVVFDAAVELAMV
jgi:hypothetical protein